MSEGGNYLSDKDLARVGQSVQVTERMGVGGNALPTRFDLGRGTYGEVTCSSTTTVDGYYPGNLMVWDEVTVTFGTTGASIWIKQLNGRALITGVKYLAKQVEHSRTPSGGSARPLFVAMQASVSVDIISTDCTDPEDPTSDTTTFVGDFTVS